MIKKHSKLFSVLLALVLLACAIGGYFYFKNEAYKKELTQFNYWVMKPEIDQATILEDGKAVFITHSYSKKILEERKLAKKVNPYSDFEEFEISTGKRYIVTMEARLKDTPYQTPSSSNLKWLQRDKAEKGEYWKLHVYKVEEKKLSEKVIDIFQITQEYNREHGTDYVPSIVGDNIGESITYKENQEVVPIVLRKKNKEKEDSAFLSIVIDLDTGKIKDEKEESYQAINSTVPFIQNTSLDKQFKQHGVDVFGNEVQLQKGVTKKEVESWQFGQKYPKLVSPLFEAISYTSDDYRSNKPLSSLYILQLGTDIETSSQVVSLFYPNGTNIFENVTIPAKHSVDNQDHVVHSYEEFVRYYDKSKESN